MIIERVLIVDHKNGEAGKYSFKTGANVIISQDNTQGKSSLVKTIYHGLGMKINRFPKNWVMNDLAIKLDLFNETTQEHLYVIRIKDQFHVTGEEHPLTLTEYTRWLSKQLNVDLKLTVKLNKMTKSVSYPSALIAPFYIDQDEGWSGRLFSSSNEVKMYMETPERIFDYLLNISDDEDQKMKERLSKLQADSTLLTNKHSSIDEVYKDYINKLPQQVTVDVTNVSRIQESNDDSVQKFLTLVEEANKVYLKHKASRINLQRELDQKTKSLSEFNTILKLSEDDYKYIKTVCKHCKSELTPEQVKTRLEISSNIIELTNAISILEKDILVIQQQIDAVISNESTAKEEYDKLTKEVESHNSLKSLSEYVEVASTKKSQEEFATILQNLNKEIEEIDAKIKELKAEQKESQKVTLKLAGEIKERYSDFVTNLSMMMAGSNVSNVKYRDFKAPKSSGVDDNQTYLGLYLAYMRLIAEYGRYQLPFCVDSFIKNETTDDKTQKMFEATEEYLFDKTKQSILTVIQNNLDRFVSKDKDYNLVYIGARLLSADEYSDGVKEITRIIKT